MHRKDTKSLHNINNQHLKQRAIGKTYLWLLFLWVEEYIAYKYWNLKIILNQ